MRSTEKPLTPAGLRILEVASELFYTRGIRAVGVDLIAEASGTTKKTLYDRFGSKDELVTRYLLRRHENWCAFVMEYLDEHAPAPGDGRILATLDALAAWMAHNERGCGFVNAFAELGGSDHPANAVVHESKKWIRRLYEDLVSAAGYRDAKAVAAQLTVVHEGALVVATVGRDPGAIDHARAAAADLLRSHAGNSQASTPVR